MNERHAPTSIASCCMSSLYHLILAQKIYFDRSRVKYHVNRLDLRYNNVSECYLACKSVCTLPSSFSFTSSFLNSGTSLDMVGRYVFE